MFGRHTPLHLALALALGLMACSDEPRKVGTDPCEDNGDCADNICHLGICASATPKALGAACIGKGECKSFNCADDGSGSKTCQPGTAAEGAACLHDEECLGAADGTLSCVDGTCAAAAPQKVEAYMPAENAITGWTEDTSKGAAGVEAGYTKAEIEALIDGKHDPYDAQGCTGFAQEFYTKDYGQSCEGKLTLYLWQMNDAAGAKAMFDKDRTDGETQSGLTFEEITGVTEQGILAFDAIYIAYAYKHAYVMQLSAEVTGATCGDQVKEDVKTWVKQLTQSLP